MVAFGLLERLYVYNRSSKRLTKSVWRNRMQKLLKLPVGIENFNITLQEFSHPLQVVG